MRNYLVGERYYYGDDALTEALAGARKTVASGLRYCTIFAQNRAHIAMLDHKTGYFSLLSHATKEEAEVIMQANRVEEFIRSSIPTVCVSELLRAFA